MSYTLSYIPTGTEELTLSTKIELEKITEHLRECLDTTPCLSRLDTGYSFSSNFRAHCVLEMFTLFDKFMYNIGTKESNYNSSYFHVMHKDIEHLWLDGEYYSSAIANIRVLVDKKLKHNTELRYSEEIFTELRAASLQMQETNRHIVRVLKTDDTILVLTNKITWSMIFKLKALAYVIFKDRYSTYNTDILNACTGLATGNLEMFNKYITKFFNYKTWEKYKRITLRDCFKTDKAHKLEQKEFLINEADEEAESCATKYARALERLQKLKEEYEMLLNTNDKINIDEILDYIYAHRYITSIDKFGETKIKLNIKAPLIYFDEEYIESYKNFRNNDIKYVMHEVFLKQKYRLWTDAAVVLNTTNFIATPLRLDSTECTYIPHPHLSFYSCMGNHGAQIEKWINNYDYIGCIEQIMVMVYNINWTDGIVINRMMDHLNNHRSEKVFEVVGTGEFVSFNDILITKEENE